MCLGPVSVWVALEFLCVVVCECLTPVFVVEELFHQSEVGLVQGEESVEAFLGAWLSLLTHIIDMSVLV